MHLISFNVSKGWTGVSGLTGALLLWEPVLLPEQNLWLLQGQTVHPAFIRGCIRRTYCRLWSLRMQQLSAWFLSRVSLSTGREALCLPKQQGLVSPLRQLLMNASTCPPCFLGGKARAACSSCGRKRWQPCQVQLPSRYVSLSVGKATQQ